MSDLVYQTLQVLTHEVCELRPENERLRARLAKARKMVDDMMRGNSEFHLCATMSVRDDLRALQDILKP